MAKKSIKFEVNPLLGGPSLDARVRYGSPYRELPIADIIGDTDQPRRVFEPEALSELASSIKEHGILCPVLVRISEGGKFKLIAGERRLRAAKLAGLDTVPAIVDQDEDQSATLGKQLVENLQREDLTPMERALAIGQLRDKYEWSIREIASHLGISKAAVQRSLEVLGLPDDLHAALIAGASESKVLLLAQVTDRELRKELISKLESLTREQIEIILSGTKADDAYHGGTKSKKRHRDMNTEDTRIMEDIQKSLGIKVELTRKKDGHGRVVLNFYSPSDLYEIYRRLTA